MNTAARVTSQQIRRADETVGGWLLALVDGQGNSPSHIIVTAVLGCVPVVGQLFDLRDLIRGIIAVAARGAGVWAWVDLLITLIGCIPGFGDAFKAGVKLARQGQNANRVFDAMRRYGRVDPRRALQQINWSGLEAEAIGLLRRMLDEMVEVLDNWVVKLVAGRQQVSELITALRQVRQDAPQMMRKAIAELKATVNRLLGQPVVASTAARTAVRQAPAPKPAAATRRTTRDNTPAPVARGVPNSAQVRQSKRNRWNTGVPAQHIVDYHVKEKRRHRKINDHGRLVEEHDRHKKLDDVVVRDSVIHSAGLDHLWFGAHRGRQYTVGETKGSVWAQFSFLAGMSAQDKGAVEDSRAATAAVLDGKGAYDPGVAMKAGRTAAETATITDERALSDPTKRTGTLKATKTKGRQMSHFWIQASIDQDVTIAKAHKVKLRRAINAARDSLEVPTVYHREVFMVTGHQYELHDRSKGQRHVVQPPIIQLPDAVLVK